MKQPSTAFVPKFCCEKSCTRVARVARKISDFWVSACERHADGDWSFDLSFTKAIDQLKGTFKKRGPAA